MSDIITIRVQGQQATTETNFIVSDNTVYTARFEFSAEWDAYAEKTVRIVTKDGYIEKTMTGNSVELPKLGAKVEKFSLGVYAGDLRATTPTYITVLPSILDGNTPVAPSAGVPLDNDVQDADTFAYHDTADDETHKVEFSALRDIFKQQPSDWNETNTTSGSFIKNKPFYDISEKKTSDNQFVSIVNMVVGGVVKLNDYAGMLLLWKSVNNVLGNMGSPWFIFRFFSTKFNEEIDFSYELYTNRQDITMLDETNFYTEFVASFGNGGQKKARIYFILDTTKLDTENAELFKAKGIYYRCVESMSSLQSCKIGIMYKTVTRLNDRYLQSDVESAKYKVKKLEDANNPEYNYPSVKAVKTALDTKLTRLNAVIEFNEEQNGYVSSIDFATLHAAIDKPNEYLVTATVGNSAACYSVVANFDTIIYFSCVNANWSNNELNNVFVHGFSIDHLNNVIIENTVDLHHELNEAKNAAALVKEDNGAIRVNINMDGLDTLGRGSVNTGQRVGATGISSFATGYAMQHPRYGWGFLANTASGNNSAAFGSGTKATQDAQFVCGNNNEEDTEGRYQFIVGVGGRNGFAVTINGEIVMPDPNASPTTYMKARFNSDGTITLSPVADETTSYTTECTANRTTSITAESTDTQYPTAKAVYDAIQAAIANLNNTGE